MRTTTLAVMLCCAFASAVSAQDKSGLNLDEQRFHRRAVESAFWGTITFYYSVFMAPPMNSSTKATNSPT